jgi:hypothetical protein
MQRANAQQIIVMLHPDLRNDNDKFHGYKTFLYMSKDYHNNKHYKLAATNRNNNAVGLQIMHVHYIV